MAVFALLVAVVGCGEEAGVADGATVSAYVSAPLCSAAGQELARSNSRVDDLRVRAVCVDDVGGGDSRLAAIGAAARRATEDSSAIAYIGTPDHVVVRFSEPILEEASIARISTGSGADGMARLLEALRVADTSGSLREGVGDELR